MGVDQLKEFGETRRGWLGVRIQDVTPDVAEAMGLEEAAGALITDVPDGPAKEAGLLSGDVITSFDGVEVADTRALVRQVGNTTVGKSVRVIVYREGATKTVLVTLGRREDAEREVPASMPGGDAPDVEQKDILGLTLGALTEERRTELKVPEGTDGLVVLEVDEASEAFEKGLRMGDVITEAGHQKVSSLTDLDERITQATEAG